MDGAVLGGQIATLGIEQFAHIAAVAAMAMLIILVADRGLLPDAGKTQAGEAGLAFALPAAAVLLLVLEMLG